MALDGLLEQLIRGQGGGAPGATPGMVPMGGGLDATVGLPYAAGAPVSGQPLTNEMFGNMYRMRPYPGFRATMKMTGQPLGLPAAGESYSPPGALATIPTQYPNARVMPGAVGELGSGGVHPVVNAYASQIGTIQGQQGALGAAPVTTGQMGGGAAPIPFANNGPNMGAIPNGVNGNIPASLYAQEAATAAPGSIPFGAGADTGAGSMPYTGAGTTPVAGAGGSGGAVPPSGTATAAAAAEDAAAGGGRFAGLLGRLRGSGGAGAAEAAATEGATAGRLGVLGAGGLKGGLARGALGIGVGYGLGKGAEAAGNGIVGQFLEGASIGAPAGGIASLPGMAVGALGVGLGNVLTHGGVGDLVHGAPQTPFETFMAGQQTTDPTTGQPTLTPLAQVMASLNDPTDDTFAAMGIAPDTAKGIQDQFTQDIAQDGSQENRVAALQRAAQATIDAATQAQGGGAIQGMTPQDIAAMQILATQLFSPIAADAQAQGAMQASALGALAPSLPSQYQDVIAQMQQQAGDNGNRMANAYIQQAGAIPQIHALGRQQALIDQAASQLTSQAMGGLISPGTGGSGVGLDQLLAAQGGGGSAADIIAAMQNAGG